MYLQLDNVHTYYGQSHVLQGVSLEIAEGEVVALLGLNGAGKTTTLRSIMGLTPPARGRIVFKGEDITSVKPYRIARKGLGYVPETREVFSLLSVEENLTLRANRRARWTLQEVFKLFPALQELRDRKGSQLSGGQQQMMVIARALMTGPDLLLLDEPSQGLAPVVVNDVLAMLRQLKSERLSVLLVEQSIKVALELADRLYVMTHGEIVYHGKPRDLASDPELIRRYIGMAA